MLFYKGENTPHFSSVSEDKMSKRIPRKKALQIYCVGNGFGKLERFDEYFQERQTYREFIEKLVDADLLVEVRG